MNKKEILREMRAAHPDWTLAKLAHEIGVSRQYVHNFLKAEGMPTAATPLTIQEPGAPIRRPDDAKFTTTHSAGAAGELQVAADLMLRGLTVYRALHPHSACDLIVLIDRVRPVRIEVKSSLLPKVQKRTVTYAPRPHKSHPLYDVLAIPHPDGQITYRPPIEKW